MMLGSKWWPVLTALLIVIAAGIGAWISQRLIRDEPSMVPSRDSLSSATDAAKVHKPNPPDNGFVGSEACGQCHQAVTEAYRTHPMAKSLVAVKNLVGTENELANQLVEPPGPRKYRIRCDGNRLWHHEFLPDPSGSPVYDQSVELIFALGSGMRGRAYLLERSGRLFASSLNWYTRTQQWGLAPGYSPAMHKRFEREVGQGCLICHAGRLNENPDHLNRLATPIFLETAIGCERCHGPGRGHVEFHTRQQPLLSDQTERDPIVNPSKLDVSQREDVCNQCHLQGESQHLRYGRRMSDFRPGMRLEDVWLVFVPQTALSSGGQVEAVSQVEQMRSSVCYSRSEGKLGCLSCHDAHSIPPRSQQAEFYRQRCQSCHSDVGCRLPEQQRLQSPEGNSCIACHMPSLGTSDVPHTTQTDHRILRHKNRPLKPSPQLPSQDLVLFNRADERLPHWESRRARGLMLASFAEKTRERRFAEEAEFLLESTRNLVHDDIAVIESLGVAKLLLGKFPEARAVWESGLTLNPHHESLLIRLAFFCHDLHDLPASANYFDRLLKVNPSHSAYHGRQAHILGQLGDFDRAIQEANRALEIDPTLSQVHEWLAMVYERRGDTNSSAHHRLMSQKLRQAGF